MVLVRRFLQSLLPQMRLCVSNLLVFFYQRPLSKLVTHIHIPHLSYADTLVQYIHSTFLREALDHQESFGSSTKLTAFSLLLGCLLFLLFVFSTSILQW